MCEPLVNHVFAVHVSCSRSMGHSARGGTLARSWLVNARASHGDSPSGGLLWAEDRTAQEGQWV